MELLIKKIGSNLSRMDNDVTVFETTVRLIGTPEDSDELREGIDKAETDFRALVKETLECFHQCSQVAQGSMKSQRSKINQFKTRFKESLAIFENAHRRKETKLMTYDTSGISGARTGSYRSHNATEKNSSSQHKQGTRKVVRWDDTGISDDQLIDQIDAEIDLQNQVSELQRLVREVQDAEEDLSGWRVQSPALTKQEVDIPEVALGLDLNRLLDQEAQVHQLESDIVEVTEIFRDLKEIIHDQREYVESVNANVDEVNRHVTEGSLKIAEVEELDRKSRRKRLVLMSALVGSVAVIGLYLYKRFC